MNSSKKTKSIMSVFRTTIQFFFTILHTERFIWSKEVSFVLKLGQKVSIWEAQKSV